MKRDNDPDRPPTDQHVVVERQGPADDADRVIDIRRMDRPESGDQS
jgi:hypothetical protein